MLGFDFSRMFSGNLHGLASGTCVEMLILWVLQLQFAFFCFEGIEFCFKSPLSRFQDGVPNFRSLFFRSMSLCSQRHVHFQKLKQRLKMMALLPVHSLGSFLGVAFVFYGVLIHQIKHGDSYRINSPQEESKIRKLTANAYIPFSLEINMCVTLLKTRRHTGAGFQHLKLFVIQFLHSSW